MPGSETSPLLARARAERKPPSSTPSAASAAATAGAGDDPARIIPFSVLEQKRQAHALDQIVILFGQLSTHEQAQILGVMRARATATTFARLPAGRRSAILAALEAEVRAGQAVQP